jgi:putative transposase
MRRHRRLHILLKREGWEVNWKKLYRLYREEGMTVRKRGGRKRAIGARAPMAILGAATFSVPSAASVRCSH